MAARRMDERSSLDGDSTGLRDRRRAGFAWRSPMQQRMAAFLLDNLMTASDQLAAGRVARCLSCSTPSTAEA
jgi:hypothetical protein